MTSRSTWEGIVRTAREEAKAAHDWARANAIERAQRYLHDPRVARSWDEATNTLTVVSPQSGATYITNGTCQRDDGTPCPAWADGRACWHWEAKNLLHRLIDSLPPPEVNPQAGPLAPVPPSPPLDAAAVAMEEREVVTLAQGAVLGSRTIPLHVGGEVVAFAGDVAEADHWLRRYEPVFLSLE